MTHAARNPLIPDRDGMSASCVATPKGSWPLMLDFLAERMPALSREAWAQRMSEGWLWSDAAQPIPPHAPFQAHTRLYYWRHVASEPALSSPVAVVFQDEHVVIADKPHFMPVTPSGPYVQRSLLVHLKRRLNLPELSPIHRIDRDTAGLVAFAVQASERSAYQNLFRDRAVAKRYEAVAPWTDLDEALKTNRLSGLGVWSRAPELALTSPHQAPPCSLPWRYRSHLSQSKSFFTMHETPAPASCETHVQALARSGPWGLYTLTPYTGKRHQLRAHLSAWGLPIRHDPYYPHVSRSADDPDQTDQPLQLLARALAFNDPITGSWRHFISQQTLAWPPSAQDA